MFERFKRFAVIAINHEGTTPEMMGSADTAEEADEIKERATRAGWLAARVVDTETEELPFSK
jgi:hypothetical protein